MIKRKTFCIRKRPTWSLKRAFTLYTGHRFGTWVERRLNRALVNFIAGARTVFKKTTSTLTCLWSPWKYCCLHLEFERTLNILLHTKQRSYHSVLRGKSWSDNCPADRLWQSCFSPGSDRFSTWRTGNCRLYNNQQTELNLSWTRSALQGGKTYWACVNVFAQISWPGLKKWRDFKYFIA